VTNMPTEAQTKETILAEPVFVEGILMEAASGNRPDALELVSLFREVTDAAFQEQKIALDRGDFGAVRRLAHRSAGSAAACGLPRLTMALRAVETAPDASVAQAWHMAERMYGEARAALDRFYNTESES